MQFTNRIFCKIEIINIFNYKYYRYRVGFVKLASGGNVFNVCMHAMYKLYRCRYTYVKLFRRSFTALMIPFPFLHASVVILHRNLATIEELTIGSQEVSLSQHVFFLRYSWVSWSVTVAKTNLTGEGRCRRAVSPDLPFRAVTSYSVC